MVRIFLKALTIAFGGCVLVVGLAFGWFFFYSRDLPDFRSLTQFAPRAPTAVSDACFGNTAVAIPYDSIGANLRAALSAAEGGEEGAQRDRANIAWI
jgi:membrane carboxypeptidase/penicillin-binding protein